MVMEIVVSLVLLFVGIAVLVSIHVCIVGRAFRRENHDANQGQSSSSISFGTKTILCSNELKELPCFDYKEAEKLGGNLVDCAVCLENFKVGDVCRLLPKCSHGFHIQCIDSWIVKTPICPICRTWVYSPMMIPKILSQEGGVSDNAVIEMA